MFHEARAASLECRAIDQAAQGHYLRAARLERRSQEQRVDAVVATALRPSVVGTAVVAAEVAALTRPRPAVMVGAAVATDIAIRDAEMAALANRARYDAYPSTNVIVTPGAVPVGGYPGQYGGYPPAAGVAGYPGYPPAVGYPPAGYQQGYPQAGPGAYGYPPTY